MSRLAARPALNFGARPFTWSDWLPTEHGFLVMLAAAQMSALLRTRGSSLSVLTAAVLSGAMVFGGSWSHRRIRKSSSAQVLGSVVLALSSVPVELAGALPLSSIASAALARGVAFVASALLVRAVFAGAARGGARRSLLAGGASVGLPALSSAALFALGRPMEAATCVIVGVVCAVLAWSRPTVKQLKPLGLTLAGLALATAITLAL